MEDDRQWLLLRRLLLFGDAAWLHRCLSVAAELEDVGTAAIQDLRLPRPSGLVLDHRSAAPSRASACDLLCSLRSGARDYAPSACGLPLLTTGMARGTFMVSCDNTPTWRQRRLDPVVGDIS